MKRKSKSIPELETESEQPTSRAPWSPEGQTILSTMEWLTPKLPEDCLQNHDLILDAPEAYAYLEDRLQMTHIQTMIIVCGVYYTLSRGRFDVSDLGEMMCLHPMQLCQLREDLDVLFEKGYIGRCANRMSDDNWAITKHALDALQKNERFDAESLKLATNMDFLTEVNRIIRKGEHFDSDEGIRMGIHHLMTINGHLPLVRNIKKESPDMNSTKALLAMMATISIEEYSYADMSDLTDVMSPSSAKSIMRAFRQNTHPFVKEGIIEAFGEDGMAQGERWCISLAGWKRMLENDKEVELITDTSSQSLPLISCNQLKKKELFFSGKTAEQTQRLEQLLSDEQYRHVREALRKKDMPIGFSCLFYGAPGTGKTELVQQLAITTGRDIYQVNLASLRDKYVGETEKRVRAVFDSYRVMVQRCPKTPILFFNEADAIFGNRMENTQRSVDKMENAVQNIILQEMERLDGIMICTTNLTSTLDKAFDRRFLYKVEFERPTNEVRKQIWKSKLNGLTDEQADTLASTFDFSGGQIENISRKQIINAVLTDNDQLDYDQIVRDCKEEKMSRNNGNKIGF